jgi:hypothetical protein
MPDQIGRILAAKKVITLSELDEAVRLQKQTPEKYLGQILCEMGLPQSRIMNAIYYSNKRRKLGQVLVDLKIITDVQLQEVLHQQKVLKTNGFHGYLATLLVKNKIISEENYIQALSAHFSMPMVSLKEFKVSPLLQKSIGEKYSLANQIVVLDDSPKKVSVALAEPHLSVFVHLEKAMPRGKYIMFCIAKASEIEDCLEEKYDPYVYFGTRNLL